MIKCQVCGYDNRDDAQFCMNCGSPVEKPKMSEALDDVSEERTVMLDPAAMQNRMSQEFKERQQAAPPPPAPAPAPVAPPPPPPAAAPAPPPAAAPAAPPPPPAAPPAAAPPPPVAAPTQNSGAASTAGTGGDKNWLVTLLLAIFLGWLGVHRFYVGKIGTGILQLITGGGCGIWQIIDIIMIAVGSFTDADGNALVKD
ncbi:MAG: hypothetical protein PWP23_1035 [Candidatus Sumerlaeota bacterium]|nr:hypothetical protein [Candidatus Sumerlaeota bacterium]